MFGIGSAELLLILVVALLALGPKNLAGASRKLGRAMGEFRRVSNDFQRALNVEAAKAEADEKSRNARKLAKKPAQTIVSEAPAGEEIAKKPAPENEMNESSPDASLSPLDAAIAHAKREAENSAQTAPKENG